MKQAEIIRNILKEHRIETKRSGFAQDKPGLVQKCAGCVWVGWDHDEHVAEAIETALGEAMKTALMSALQNNLMRKPPNQAKDES